MFHQKGLINIHLTTTFLKNLLFGSKGIELSTEASVKIAEYYFLLSPF